jgi:hypothetical protein
MWQVLGGIAIAVALVLGGYKAGHAVAAIDAAQERAAQQEKVIVHQQVLVKEVPKIVTRTVTKEVTVEKEVERVVTVAHDLLAPDCVLPDNFGMLLVAAANGADPSTGDVDAFRGAYDCRATLAAVLADLSAGWRNSARLDGLQEWARLVTEAKPAP